MPLLTTLKLYFLLLAQQAGGAAGALLAYYPPGAAGPPARTAAGRAAAGAGQGASPGQLAGAGKPWSQGASKGSPGAGLEKLPQLRPDGQGPSVGAAADGNGAGTAHAAGEQMQPLPFPSVPGPPFVGGSSPRGPGAPLGEAEGGLSFASCAGLPPLQPAAAERGSPGAPRAKKQVGRGKEYYALGCLHRVPAGDISAWLPCSWAAPLMQRCRAHPCALCTPRPAGVSCRAAPAAAPPGAAASGARHGPLGREPAPGGDGGIRSAALAAGSGIADGWHGEAPDAGHR